LQDAGEIGMESTRYHQNRSSKFVQGHEHLLLGLRLRNNAHLVFDRQNLGDPRAKNCLVVGQYQFEHLLRTSRLRLANKIVGINYTSHALRVTDAGVFTYHSSLALHDNVLVSTCQFWRQRDFKLNT